MKRFALLTLCSFVFTAVAFVAFGYGYPYLGLRETKVNRHEVRVMRGYGFFSTIDYRRDRLTGDETVFIQKWLAYTEVDYRGACKCVVKYERQSDGWKNMLSVSSLNPRDGKLFIMTGGWLITGPPGDPDKGKYIWLGYWRTAEELKPYFDEGRALLESVRARYADKFPKT